MSKQLIIGTRDSQLAVWQATLVKDLLAQHGYECRLEYIKSDGDLDLSTPLYEMGVQGVFTRNLDAALLNKQIDIAVHSMKDVPTQLAKGIVQAAVLERASYKDILVLGQGAGGKEQDIHFLTTGPVTIATSSIRRKAQWLHRYPTHTIENLRGNVNTRLRKVAENNWYGAIFAAAGVERIGLRPANSITLDWMLPAPAQGAIMIVCREEEEYTQKACALINDEQTATCVKEERDFLRILMGGCSTPISALATIEDNILYFKGNILSLDGKEKIEIEKKTAIHASSNIGIEAAQEVLQQGGKQLVELIKYGKS